MALLLLFQQQVIWDVLEVRLRRQLSFFFGGRVSRIAFEVILRIGCKEQEFFFFCMLLLLRIDVVLSLCEELAIAFNEMSNIGVDLLGMLGGGGCVEGLPLFHY